MSKIHIKGIVSLLAVAAIGMAALPVTANASSSYYNMGRAQYVRTKKAMYVGIYQKKGNTYKPLLKKKGSLLRVSSTTQKSSNSPVLAAFTSGAVHYNRLNQLKFNDTPTVPLTKANFQKVALKAPIRGTVLRAGSGFKEDSNGNFGNASAFYLTLDNYLQYYSKSAMVKYDAAGTMIIDGGHRMDNYKPTASAKMTKTTVKGNTTTVQYRTPIKGVPGKKLGAHKYQIKITYLNTIGHKSFGESYGSNWGNYTINGRPYFSGIVNDY
ncbi:hypothetical protein [Levilactobacillus enshiensis]|uniref:hypothetical protein n=1 Tax=Levilactobacillus enshiensis TaxID=2590213 RepID=UPI001179A675|nr:hypothetical protein [Levilactobacillus enshiensis]